MSHENIRALTCIFRFLPFMEAVPGLSVQMRYGMIRFVRFM